jgi:hypothetical protein
MLPLTRALASDWQEPGKSVTEGFPSETVENLL